MFLLGAAATAAAQNTPEMREVLSRLGRLERDNQELAGEVRALRKELAGLRDPAPDEQHVAAVPEAPHEAESIQRARIEELAQTKVEASQKFPIRITGMALFNAYVNGQHNGDSINPPVASFNSADSTGGGTLAQSTLGLLYNGPRIFGDGKVNGSLYMDFFGGSSSSIGHTLRIRTAAISLDWANTSVTFGQDKPIISPRDPDSLAQVGISPLTGAGNPWLWQPQIRIEQRLALSPENGFRLQAGVFQTSVYGNSASAYQPEESRPGVEGRLQYWHGWGEAGRLEIAGGIHQNRNHLGRFSLPSNVYSVDWFFRPIPKIELSGMFFHGRNVQVLGALPPGYNTLSDGRSIPVRSNGGWGQLRIPITSRLAFNVYGGTQVQREVDLSLGNPASNAAYFTNFMYRVAPNVIVSLEGGQVRTSYYQTGNRLNNHYDLAIAYLF